MFLRNLQMALEAPEILAASVKIQYLRALLCGKALRQLEKLSVEVGSTTISHLNRIILGLDTYFPPANVIPKQKAQWATECGSRGD